MLTPEDIEQKTFSTALRGYDLNEVDDFLDEIMTTIRDLHEQLEAARSGQPVVQAPPAAAAEAAPAPAVAVDESAVGRALVAAQEAADRILAEASAEAERIRESAQQEADSWISEREESRAAAEKEMADLSSRVDAVRRELAFLATGVADSLDRMDEVIAGAQPEISSDSDESEDGAEMAAPRHAAAAGDESLWDDDGMDADESDGGDGDAGDTDGEGSPDTSYDSEDGSPDFTPDSPDADSDDSPDEEEDDSDDEGSSF